MRKCTSLLLFFILCLLGNTSAQIPITFNPKTDFTTGTNSLFTATADFNGDGLLDLAVTSQIDSVVSVLFNTTTPGASSPSFSSKTDFFAGGITWGVSVSDFNGDGKLDLAVSTSGDTTISVFLNTTVSGASTPTFSPEAEFNTGSGSRGIAIGDFNLDGKPDLAVTNQGTGNVSVFLNTTTPGASIPTFSSKSDFFTGTQATSVSVGDFNGDGKSDLAVVGVGFSFISVLLNTTTAGATIPTFSAKTDFTTGTNPIFVSMGDLNLDGKPDVAVANLSDNSVSVLINTTTPGSVIPSFSAKTDFQTGKSPTALFITDFNGDGKQDLVVSNATDSSVSVFANNTTPGAAAPSFASKSDFQTFKLPNSVISADFNGDGKPDLAVPASNNVSILFNNTNIGSQLVAFNSKTDFLTNIEPRSVCNTTDINNDGKPDLIISNKIDNNITVFINNSTPGGSSPSFYSKTDFSVGKCPRTVRSADFNLDGMSDLCVVNDEDSSLSILLNTTSPGDTIASFRTKADFMTGVFPTDISIVDINKDGKLDLAILTRGINSFSIFLNQTSSGATTPSFSARTDFATNSVPWSIASTDLNGDGKNDIIIANTISSNLSVYLNTTSPGSSIPTFSPKMDISGIDPFSITTGDINGDGKPDVAVVNPDDNSVSVLLNNTAPGANTPSFLTKTNFTTGGYPLSVNIKDLNGDFKNDLVIVNNDDYTVSILINNTSPGSSTPLFLNKTDYSTGNQPVKSNIADFNLDGKPDIAVANIGANTVSVLLNSLVTGVESDNSAIPSNYILSQNYPNPFNPSTNIIFSIPNESFVTLKIYDILGKEVIQLVNQRLKTGNYNFSFDAKGLTSGVYFYRLQADSFVETKKMLLIK